MDDKKYFNSEAIGSSLLATVIQRIEPLELCFDYALKEPEPTQAMEMGRIFEDWMEEQITRELVFTDKYFRSDLKTFPATGAKGVKNILEMFENERLVEDEKGLPRNSLHLDIERGYIYNKPNKKTGVAELSGTHVNRHRLLDQIKAHDYRRPIIAPDWDNLMSMDENFKLAPFSIGGVSFNLFNLLCRQEAEFQVEHFWKHESGAECREKLDIVLTYTAGDSTYAIPFDLKATGDQVSGLKSFGAFKRNWSSKYIWQSKHYMEGFKDYCGKYGYIPSEKIWYLVQESSFPHLLHAWALSVGDLDYLDKPYNEAMPLIQEWIDAGKPKKGYTEQRTVDRFGRPLHINASN